MSRTLILKNCLMATVCVAGLTLTACASSEYNDGNSRYGNVYDYESGGNCNAGPCGAAVAAPAESRYGSIGGQQISSAPVYADCSVVGGMNCNAQAPQSVTVYAPPAPVYQAQTPTYSTGGSVPCPAGTTASGNGTCMESGGYSGYSSTTTTPTYTGSTSSYSGEKVPCPAGTTSAADGTCLQSGGYDSYSSTTTSSSSYGSSSSSYGSASSYGSTGEMADCPAGTTSNGDGTCMEGTGSHSNVTIYSGSSTSGYTQPQEYTAPTTYLPIRK